MEPEKSIIKEFISGGWVIVTLGAASMVARILADEEKNTIVVNLKKIAAASILTAVVWAFVHDLGIKDLHEAIIYGVTGVISPEILQGVVKIGKAFAAHPLRFLKKK